jgi:hypothetical protein
VLLGASASRAAVVSNAVEVPDSENKLLVSIAKLHVNRQYKKALALIPKAEKVSSNGDEERVWLQLMRGALLHRVGNKKGADDALRKALEMDPQANLPLLKPADAAAVSKRFEELRQEVVASRRPAPPPMPPPPPAQGAAQGTAAKPQPMQGSTQAAPPPPPTQGTAQGGPPKSQPEPWGMQLDLSDSQPAQGATQAAPPQPQPQPAQAGTQRPREEPLAMDSGSRPLPGPSSAAGLELRVGLRGEMEVFQPHAVPSLSVEVVPGGQKGLRFGGALGVILQPATGVRAEARLFPHDIQGPVLIQPYALVGTTAFLSESALAARVGAGVGARKGHLYYSLDVAFERFLNSDEGRLPNAALVSLGVSWAP